MFRDIDVGIFVAGQNSSTFFDIELDLSLRVEKALPGDYPVDVKVINQSPEPFRFNVIKGHLLFTRDEDMLVEFMTTTVTV